MVLARHEKPLRSVQTVAVGDFVHELQQTVLKVVICSYNSAGRSNSSNSGRMSSSSSSSESGSAATKQQLLPLLSNACIFACVFACGLLLQIKHAQQGDMGWRCPSGIEVRTCLTIVLQGVPNAYCCYNAQLQCTAASLL
jgi:hypothetical protein